MDFNQEIATGSWHHDCRLIWCIRCPDFSITALLVNIEVQYRTLKLQLIIEYCLRLIPRQVKWEVPEQKHVSTD